MHTITIPCPHLSDAGDVCEAPIVLQVECTQPYEPMTRDYPGVDAVWEVTQEIPRNCTEGCPLSLEEQAAVEAAATREAAIYEPGADEDDAPDYDDNPDDGEDDAREYDDLY